MNWTNELTRALKIQYPVIQAPMLGVTSPEMVAAISNQGGLGSLPVGGLSPEKTREIIRKTKALTSKPFAVNLFVNDIPIIDNKQAIVMQQFLERLGKANGIHYETQHVATLRFYSYKEQVNVILNEAIPVVSFTFGIPNDASIKAFHDKNVVLMGTATNAKEAWLLYAKNIDYIVAQGIEAGGHLGSFLKNEALPEIKTMSLLDEIKAGVRTPVIAAGAINDGATIKEAFAHGAIGVQPGTAFIASNESNAIPSYKAALNLSTGEDIVLTQAFSGRWARGIRNAMMTAVEQSNLSIPPYPIQNTLTTLLRAAAQQQDNKDFTNLWAGMACAKAEMLPAAEIFLRMVREAEIDN